MRLFEQQQLTDRVCCAPGPAVWLRKGSAPKREEGREQRKERREKREERNKHDQDERVEGRNGSVSE